jgi:predicted DNA-binding transcriptional regulator AlpA
MQTFMPSGDYALVAYNLDSKRLGKQRVEAYQILRALTGKSMGWIHHPATKMWRGHEYNLAEYGLQMCEEWIRRGHNDTLSDEFIDALNVLPVTPQPWWITNRALQITHQSNLLFKDWGHYSEHYRVPDDLPYLWPLPDEEAFLCGNLKERKNTDLLKNGVVYLTSKQLAEILGVSPKTISAYKARGQMPEPDRVYGRTPLWSYATIEKWRGELRTPVVPLNNE